MYVYILRMGMNLGRPRTHRDLYRWVVAFSAERARAKQTLKDAFKSLLRPVPFTLLQLCVHNVPFATSETISLGGFTGGPAVQQYVVDQFRKLWSTMLQNEMDAMPDS